MQGIVDRGLFEGSLFFGVGVGGQNESENEEVHVWWLCKELGVSEVGGGRNGGYNARKKGKVVWGHGVYIYICQE